MTSNTLALHTPRYGILGPDPVWLVSHPGFNGDLLVPEPRGHDLLSKFLFPVRVREVLQRRGFWLLLEVAEICKSKKPGMVACRS